MAKKSRLGSLTKHEKSIVKGFLSEGKRNQDIQALVNIGRVTTINSARITEVKQNKNIKPANKERLRFFEKIKHSYNPETGLNPYEDERLIRAREAMLFAVQIFNGPMQFKTENFAVMANIAWTYLLHEFYLQRDIKIYNEDGFAISLSDMLSREDCPLSQGIKDNLISLKKIRDTVEHKLFGKGDLRFLSIYQACCLNFEKKLCELFGEEKTLKNELSFALQFAKLDFDQLVSLNNYDIPEHIKTLDKEIDVELGEDRISDLEYRFRVVYTFENATKSKSHIKFVHPNDEGAEEIQNVLIKHEISDKLYPHKPSNVVARVINNTGLKFTSHNHTQAWRKFDVRPKHGVKEPNNVNKEYCVYHEAHQDYTYSEKWVEYLSNYITDELKFNQLKKYKLK